MTEKLKKRQLPSFPGVGANEPMFPKGRELVSYVPYIVEFICPDAGLIKIILLAQLSTKLEASPMSHLEAIAAFANARKDLWKDWIKFKASLEDNDKRISEAIQASRSLLDEVHRKRMWQDIPAFLKEINIGKSLKDKQYPVNFLYSKKANVVGSVVRYSTKLILTIYDIPEDVSDNYWEFVTKYVRTHAIILPDWDKPADASIPPVDF